MFACRLKMYCIFANFNKWTILFFSALFFLWLEAELWEWSTTQQHQNNIKTTTNNNKTTKKQQQNKTDIYNLEKPKLQNSTFLKFYF